LLLAARRFLARSDQAITERIVDLAQEGEERMIHAQQPFALVEIVETNAEGKLHAVRIISEIKAETSMQIRNSIFLVTGGASGLGAASARMAAENGGKVVIADLQVEAGEKLAKELGGRFAKTDVSNEADGKAAVA